MSDDIEQTVARLRPEWAQLMANLVLRGWVIRAVEGRAGVAIHGIGSWTAHLECTTTEQILIAHEHKHRYGLRLYSAPSLLSLLEQMQPVLEEFQAIEALPHLPDPAGAAPRGSLANRTTMITATVNERSSI